MDLVTLRKEIDRLDKQLWEVIAQRVAVAHEIGEWKKAHDEPVVQAERFQQVLDNCLREGKAKGLSEELIREVMEAIHKESIRVES